MTLAEQMTEALRAHPRGKAVVAALPAWIEQMTVLEAERDRYRSELQQEITIRRNMEERLGADLLMARAERDMALRKIDQLNGDLDWARVALRTFQGLPDPAPSDTCGCPEPPAGEAAETLNVVSGEEA